MLHIKNHLPQQTKHASNANLVELLPKVFSLGKVKVRHSGLLGIGLELGLRENK